MRSIVISLDCADPELIERWENELPNLSHMKNTGTSGVLRSVRGKGGTVSTAIAWSSLYTGTSPETHGIHSFSKDNGELIVPQDISGVKIWDVLNSSDIKTGLFNVPITYPPFPINGFIVSSFLTPNNSSEWTYPKELADEISDDYRISTDLTSPKISGRYGKIDLEDRKEDIFEVMRSRKQEFMEIIDKDSDLLMANFKSLDELQHYFCDVLEDHPAYNERKRDKFGNIIKEFYIELDKFIGEVLNKISDEDYLFIISDHGKSFDPPNSFPGKLLRWAAMSYIEKDIKKMVRSMIWGRNIYTSHGVDGIFYASGPEIRKCKIERLNIIDIAPTIIHMFGETVPISMEGKVAKGIFTEDSDIRKRPVKLGNIDEQEVSSKRNDSDEVQERLQNLGYKL